MTTTHPKVERARREWWRIEFEGLHGPVIFRDVRSIEAIGAGEWAVRAETNEREATSVISCPGGNYRVWGEAAQLMKRVEDSIDAAYDREYDQAG